MCTGAPRPRASRIFCFTSGGTVSGTWAIGSPGASWSSPKITILMNKSVGIEVSMRRIVKVNISGAFVRQSLEENRAHPKVRPKLFSQSLLNTVPVSSIP